MSCTWGGSNMHLCRRRKFQVTTQPLRTYASLTHVPIISLILSQAALLFSHFERQCGSSCRQGLQLSSAFALAIRHAPRPGWAGGLVHNLHYVKLALCHMCRHAAKSSRVLQQQSNSLLFTMGYDSLHTPSYREPKLCEFGREIRIRSEPYGMAKA